MRKLRILCLHGYHGNARVLREQMRALTHGLEHLAEFIELDAPSLSQGDFGWWHAIRDESPYAPREAGVGAVPARYEGWVRTRDWINSVFEDQGPFDGIFGFSQGAALAALLVGLRSPTGTPGPTEPLVFNFVIVAGAFMASDPTLAALYLHRASYELPSVHIIGRSDLIVRESASRQVAGLFRDPIVLLHAGGHVVASSAEIQTQVSAFLQRQVARPWTEQIRDGVAPAA